MADDIIARLRDVVCWCNEFDGVCDACQAADEIERLRAALALAVGELSTVAGYKLHSPESLMNRFLDEAENDD